MLALSKYMLELMIRSIKPLSKKLFVVMLFAVGVTAGAQQISYQTLEDNPDKVYTKFIAPEIGAESNAPSLSVFVGANARYGITDAIVFEGIARFDIFQSKGQGPGFLLEAGGFLPLTSKIKRKEIPIVLSYNAYAGEKYENGQRYNVEETKSISIPDGQYKNEIGVRAGIHQRRIGSEDLLGDFQGAINLTGVYLGGQWTSQAYLKAKINNDVERIGAGFTRIYADLLVLPVSNLSEPFANQDVKADGVIGWRVGFQWYVSPHDGVYKFLGNSVFTAELGSRPLTGFLFNMSWGFALMGKR